MSFFEGYKTSKVVKQKELEQEKRHLLAKVKFFNGGFTFNKLIKFVELLFSYKVSRYYGSFFGENVDLSKVDDFLNNINIYDVPHNYLDRCEDIYFDNNKVSKGYYDEEDGCIRIAGKKNIQIYNNSRNQGWTVVVDNFNYDMKPYELIEFFYNINPGSTVDAFSFLINHDSWFEDYYPVTCKECGYVHGFRVSQYALRRWKSGMLIQKAFPNMLDWERELLRIGICGKCYDKMFEDGE